MRGLAILLVLICHYFSGRMEVSPGTWKALVVASLNLTWTGVDLFFVLSGFLIGGILCDAKASTNYYQAFYLRRIHRIFPIYFLWLLLFLAGLRMVAPADSPALRTLFNLDVPLWSYPLFLQNICMTLKGTYGAEWLAITWSLTVEEQFYLLLPLLIRKLSRRGITTLAVATVAAAPLIRLILWRTAHDSMGPYTLLPCRADALGFGVLIAIACRHGNTWEWLQSHRAHLHAALLVLGAGMAYLTVRQQHLFTFGLTWIAAFYSALLLLTIVNPGRIEKLIFRHRALTSLGTVAYAVYLFHQGINWLYHWAFFGRAPAITGWPSTGVTLLSLLTVLLLAAVSWRVIEKPLIRRAHSTYPYDGPNPTIKSLAVVQ